MPVQTTITAEPSKGHIAWLVSSTGEIREAYTDALGDLYLAPMRSAFVVGTGRRWGRWECLADRVEQRLAMLREDYTESGGQYLDGTAAAPQPASPPPAGPAAAGATCDACGQPVEGDNRFCHVDCAARYYNDYRTPPAPELCRGCEAAPGPLCPRCTQDVADGLAWLAAQQEAPKCYACDATTDIQLDGSNRYVCGRCLYTVSAACSEGRHLACGTTRDGGACPCLCHPHNAEQQDAAAALAAKGLPPMAGGAVDTLPIYGRWLLAKYGGECSVCGAAVEKGERAHWGDDRTLACQPCGEARQHTPVDPEAIRGARQAKADKRADRMLAKAARLTRDGEAKTAELRRQDYAWATQPNVNTSAGRAFTRQRDKIRARAEDGMRALAEADKLRSHADWTRHQGVAVKGDAERRYQARRDALDAVIGVGSRVSTIYNRGLVGVVTRVYPKSYRIRWENPPAYYRPETTEDKLACHLAPDPAYAAALATLTPTTAIQYRPDAGASLDRERAQWHAAAGSRRLHIAQQDDGHIVVTLEV